MILTTNSMGTVYMLRKAASVFIERLSQFLEDIKNLKMSIGLEPLPPKYERTRIVVLDSGVDENDLDIRRGIWSGCVNKQKSRSFVGHPDEWKQDTYGHGTYVAQLLLKFAPAAEIYIGKICTGKSLKDELVPGIAEVCLDSITLIFFLSNFPLTS